MSYRVLLFDIDGTLLRAGGAGKAALADTLRDLYGIEKPQVDIQYGGRTDQSITRELFQIHQLAWTPAAGQAFLSAYAQHLARTLPLHAPILLPGVHELLRLLQQEAQYLMGLLTGNIERCAQLKLQIFQLGPYFEFGGFGDSHVERADIAADAYQKASRLSPRAFQAHEVLVIGDTPADVRCARSIGADVLLVGTGPVKREALQEAAPDYFQEDLSEHGGVLELIRDRRRVARLR